MPLIQYRKYRPRKQESIDMINHAISILAEYSAQGFDLTLRQLYYQCIARDLFPDSWADAAGIKNRQANYDKLGTLIANAREGGLIDWDHIKDRGRAISRYNHFDDAQDFLERMRRGFSLDMWEDQSVRVEVWVEKQALAQVIESAADPYDVATFATKGYASASSLWDAGHNRFLRYARASQEIVIIHLADHDPSGINMTEDILNRLRMYSSPTSSATVRTSLSVHRIALTMEQVEEYTPPPNPAKETDPRFKSYEAEFGSESWELDALDPPVIVQLIQAAIEEHLDRFLYDARREEEQDQRNELERLAERYDEVKEFLEE